MSLRTSTIALSIVAGLVSLTPAVRAASPAPLSGHILGEVKSAAGVAQMGATVLLFNRYDQLVRQALTNEEGKFGFDSLTPDLYSIRVSLASFVPAIRRNISVLAGSESLLRISLASVLSTVELAPASAPAGTLMSDEWKWVLRASHATRPVLRFLPDSTISSSRAGTAMFSHTTGLVNFSAGDREPFSALQQDLGTSFAVATSLYGSAQVRVSGNIGYAPSSGLPSAGFRASYARTADGSSGPQFILTARQVYMPGLAGSGNGGGPVLRTASFATTDKIAVTDALELDYGVSLDSISFLNKLNYVNTFARASYTLGPRSGVLRVAYGSAVQPSELAGHEGEPLSELSVAELNHDVTALARLPRISRRDGRMTVQRNQTYEAGYKVVRGSRTYSAAVYQDDISNATFLMSGPQGFLSRRDWLPDLDSRGMVFNTGDMLRQGAAAAVTQSLGDNAEVTVAAGRAETLINEGQAAASAQGDDVRATIHKAPRSWLTVRASAQLPVTATHLGASYGWTDFRALTPVHYSLTGDTSQDMGWNISLRQPLPGFNGMRMEASAELRNLLAQGYLPISAGGRQAILTNSPRGVRGGVSFIF